MWCGPSASGRTTISPSRSAPRSCSRDQALLRRAGNEAPEPVAVGTLSLDVNELMLHGLPRGPIRLTPLESRFLPASCSCSPAAR